MRTRGVKEKEINNKLDLITDGIDFIEKNNEWENIEHLNKVSLSIKDVLLELKESSLWKDYVMEYILFLEENLNKIETNIAKTEKNTKSSFEIQVKGNTIRGKPK